MTAELQLSLLGKLQISLAGAPLTGFVSAKVQALLCYLAVTARPHDRQTLATLLWGEMPDTEARTNLRAALTNLRKLAAPYLLIDRDTVRFNLTSPYWLDVDLFQTALTALEPATAPPPPAPQAALALRQAIDLYRGDFLEGFSVRDAPAFEEWLLAQRDRFRHLVSQGLLALARHHSQQAELSLALDYTSRLLHLEPWREEAHRHMMQLLAQSGQRSAALAQFESCRRLLAEELGVSPSPETVALYERLRQAEAPRPHNLPPQPTPFVGREKELAQLGVYLAQPERRLLSLVGLGGVGKSRLALQAAWEQRGLFRDGVFFVPLAPVTSVEGLLTALAGALNFGLSGPVDPRQQVLSYLSSKELLLVLDNFEPLLAQAEAVNLVVALLQRAPQVKLLVTSRERLNLHEEWVVELEGLSYPRSREQAREASDAVRLFIQQARRVQAEFELAPNEAAVVRLCQLVQGMPLGLELAATWLPVLSCEEIVAEIAQDLDFLASGVRNVPERHRSMRAVFESSWSLLAGVEQGVLMRLAVFRGGFEREAAAQVAGASLPVLLGLLSKSLLRRDAAGRYDMHDLVRQFAAEKLAGEDRAVASQQQHAHYYLALVKQAEPELHGANQVAWRQRLEHELDNLRTALTWAIENQKSEICLELAIGLGWFWFIGGHLIEGRDWLTKILALPDPVHIQPLRAKALNVAGLLAFYHADYAASSKAYQESVAISEAIADRATLADALHGLGNSFWYQGNQTEAVPLLEKSLALYTGLADQAGVAASLSRLGAIASYRDEHDIALSLSERSLAIYKTLDDKRGMIYTLCNLAEATMYKQQAYEAACSLYEQCLSIAREVQDKPGIAAVLFSLADLALTRQDYLQAETYAHEALALAQQLGDPWQPPRMMRLLGYAALQRGDIAQATSLFVESIYLNQKLEDQRGVIASLAAMASVANAQQQFEIAAHRLAMVQAVLATLKDPLLPADQVMYDQTMAATRAKLSPEQFDAAWAEGAHLTLEQEIESALAHYKKKPR